MVLLIFSIIIFPFLFKSPGLGWIFYQGNFLYALFVGQLLIRTYFNGDNKFNYKPFFISLSSSLIYLVYFFLISPLLKNQLYPERFANPVQGEAAKMFGVYAIMVAFVLLGLVALGFFIYNIIKYKNKGNFLYRFIEGGTGFFFVSYPILKSYSYHMLFVIVATSIAVHLVYMGYFAYFKILEYRLIRKARKALSLNDRRS